MSGEIGVTSVEGKGSTFYFDIVAAQAGGEQIQEDGGINPELLAGQRALIVDDNSTYLRVFSYILGRLGCYL